MAATANSILFGNHSQIPALKPKSTSQSLLHLSKPNTVNLAGRAKPVAFKCVASTTQVQDVVTSGSVGSKERFFKFRADPATSPEIKNIPLCFCDWRGEPMSVREMSQSHRGKEFLSIMQKAESDLRQLMEIPQEYSVLFLRGGETTQFAALPLNLCKSGDTVDFVVTGSSGDEAVKEANKYCKTNVIWSGKSEKYTKVPSFDELEQTPDAKYLHICANETNQGVEFKDYPVPKNPNGILVADMSSNLCSKPVDVSKFGVIYGGAQKNVGPSGVTIVIIRKDLIGNAQNKTPVMLNYEIHDDNRSLYNKPPIWRIYMCGLVFKDLLEQGGLKEVEKKNQRKAALLYNAIEESKGYYKCPVEKSVRSLMNVRFTSERCELDAEIVKEYEIIKEAEKEKKVTLKGHRPKEYMDILKSESEKDMRLLKSKLEEMFIKEAAKEKMVQLKGHRSVGGMRASIYNAMPLAGVEKLVAFMKDFQAKHPVLEIIIS